MIKNNSLFYSLFFAFLFLGTPAKSQLLWEISGNGLEESSYLFGTIHIQDKRAFEFSDSVFAKIEECEAFAMEIQITPEAEELISKNIFLEEGNSLKKIYSKKDYAFLEKFFTDELNLNLEHFNEMKPMIVSSAIMMMNMKKEMPTSVDEYLNEYAKEKNKKLLSVEPIETQLRMIEVFKPAYLIDMTKEWDKTFELLDDMILSYQKEDLAGVLELMLTDPAHKSFLDELLWKRNISMVDSIDLIVHRQPTFIAIGTGHLPEERGVIALLQKRGYDVKPVVGQKTKDLPTIASTEVEDFSKWELVKVKKFNFEVKMPGKPKFEIEELDPEDDGELFSILYENDITNSMYGILISEYDNEAHVPSSKMSPEELERFYESNIIGAIEEIGGKVIRQENIEIDGLKAMSVDANIMGGLFEFKYVMLYHEFQFFLFQILSEKEIKGDKKVEYFLNSFKFKK